MKTLNLGAIVYMWHHDSGDPNSAIRKIRTLEKIGINHVLLQWDMPPLIQSNARSFIKSCRLLNMPVAPFIEGAMDPLRSPTVRVQMAMDYLKEFPNPYLDRVYFYLVGTHPVEEWVKALRDFPPSLKPIGDSFNPAYLQAFQGLFGYDVPLLYASADDWENYRQQLAVLRHVMLGTEASLTLPISLNFDERPIRGLKVAIESILDPERREATLAKMQKMNAEQLEQMFRPGKYLPAHYGELAMNSFWAALEIECRDLLVIYDEGNLEQLNERSSLVQEPQYGKLIMAMRALAESEEKAWGKR